MDVHLVDGTYELFRYHFAMPSHVTDEGMEVAATRGVLGTLLSILEGGATHLGVATDRVIESFRNDLWEGYKSSAGVPEELLAQFPLVEEGIEALGVVLWPMVEVEADDALAAAAAMAAADDRVRQVQIMTPDKDLGQCVVGDRVVQVDRRKDLVLDEAGVIAKMGVPPASIADYLALVGDSADGFPGLAGWGAKSAATVLARYGRIEDIPTDPAEWDVTVRGAAKLAATLEADLELAVLFRRIATVVTDIDVGTVDDLEWRGPTPALAAFCERVDAPGVLERAEALAAARSGTA